MPLCSSFSPAKFLAVATNLSSSTATSPGKIVYPMLKHISRCGMDFLLHIFNLPWILHYFFFICKTSSIISIRKMGKPLNSLASFRLISFTSYVSKLFERIILSHLLYFLESNSIFSSHQADFRPERSTLNKFFFRSHSISDGLNTPKSGSQTILTTINFSRTFDLSGTPYFSTNLIWMASLLALLVGLNFSFLIGVLEWFYKIKKATPFESVEMFCKNPFLALYCFTLHQ